MTATLVLDDPDETKPAPGPLRRVQALINTLDRETDDDRLADREGARPLLVELGLLGSDAPLSAADLAAVIGVREALHALVLHNSGGPDIDARVLRPIRDLEDYALLRVRVDAAGAVAVVPADDSVRARLAGLLTVVSEAQRAGTWAQLKACANDECLWAFYDRSRNHGGAWCDMSGCGNKLKNREFRARRRSTR
ncbi:CGNR zinc finger domain-containing protein [Mycolicibacterium lacusdiani]|uniref:CGNR zinc finger domain-containing protein n=1 Tax=Mycolicibacterium lacusdiani TaxID=2895283 RepID=UPI001F458EED|nr:CGNR zinc finger domain-containing protein [Mycolicibacterium lacusdiani]